MVFVPASHLRKKKHFTQVKYTDLNKVDRFLQQTLQARQAKQLFRELRVLPSTFADFSSNDFLGLARNGSLDKAVEEELGKTELPRCGSGGSRLISGNTAYAEQLERELAVFYHTEAALIFNSGYDANLGLLSCIASRHDTILYDQHCHASIHDGIRLSLAGTKFSFRHNDLTDLEKKMRLAHGNIFIVAESVYSMDGDTVPLEELAKLAEKYQAALIIDEAHASGIFGLQGEGLVQSKQLQNRVFARIHTFGKALGCHGAVVVGPAVLRDFLINFSRSFIYTTALPLHSLAAIHCAHQLMKSSETLREKLWQLITYFEEQSNQLKEEYIIQCGKSAIQSIQIRGNEKTRMVSSRLQAQALDVRAILSPTVPEGTERLRICLHSYNTKEQIDHLLTELNHV